MGLLDTIKNAVEKLDNLAKPTPSASAPTQSPMAPTVHEQIVFPDWYISISFGKSTSNNYAKAIALAKSAPTYHEQVDDGNILHQAIYSHKPNEYLAFIQLYELVGSWKSSFVMINGKFIDRKIVGNLNYCYGDRCRSGNPTFCHGASYMTNNPFGCHRLQISAANNPWWTFYNQRGNMWYLDEIRMQQQINSVANLYSVCPMFNYNNIINVMASLPKVLTTYQLNEIRRQQTTIFRV